MAKSSSTCRRRSPAGRRNWSKFPVLRVFCFYGCPYLEQWGRRRRKEAVRDRTVLNCDWDATRRWSEIGLMNERCIVGLAFTKKWVGFHQVPTSCRLTKASQMFRRDVGWWFSRGSRIMRSCFSGQREVQVLPWLKPNKSWKPRMLPPCSVAVAAAVGSVSGSPFPQ